MTCETLWLTLGGLYCIIGLSFAIGLHIGAPWYDKPPILVYPLAFFGWPILLPAMAAL
jgi:hypothetical protein